MSNKLLHVESAARYKHHMQVKVKYCCIGRKVDDGEIEIVLCVIKMSRSFVLNMKLYK
jgi:hypothetical protein